MAEDRIRFRIERQASESAPWGAITGLRDDEDQAMAELLVCCKAAPKAAHRVVRIYERVICLVSAGSLPNQETE